MTGAENVVRVGRRLTADEVAAVQAIVSAAATADGVAPLSEQSVFAIDEGDLHLRSPHGYANVVVPPSGGAAVVEAVVDPAFRGGGEGRELLTAALAAAADTGDRPATVWAHGDLPAARALAAALELRRTRELLQLRRPLTGNPLPAPADRGDIALRTYAGAADDAEILRVNNAAFSWHPEQGGWTQRQIDERTGAGWFDPAGLILAVDPAEPQRLLGFHWTKVHPGIEVRQGAAEQQEPAADPEQLGEVYIVAVDPAAQGRGLGGVLTLAGLHHLVARGMDVVNLYVEGDNTAALATYGRLGFTRYAVDIAYSS